MNRFWILSSWIFVLAISKGPIQTPSLPNAAELCTDKDYAIFAAALDHLYGGKKLDSVLVLDRTSTGVPPGLAGVAGLRNRIQGFYDRVPEEARRDFDARNKNRRGLESNKIKASFDVVLMHDEDSTSFYASGGWKAFYETHPGTQGIWLISLPGINREHDHALLYIGHACGSNCGGGTVLFLGKEAGKWKVIDNETLWLT